MSKLGEVFKCKLCGDVITIYKAGGNPEIMCCGQLMEKKNREI